MTPEQFAPLLVVFCLCAWITFGASHWFKLDQRIVGFLVIGLPTMSIIGGRFISTLFVPEPRWLAGSAILGWLIGFLGAFLIELREFREVR